MIELCQGFNLRKTKQYKCSVYNCLMKVLLWAYTWWKFYIFRRKKFSSQRRVEGQEATKKTYERVLLPYGAIIKHFCFTISKLDSTKHPLIWHAMNKWTGFDWRLVKALWEILWDLMKSTIKASEETKSVNWPTIGGTSMPVYLRLNNAQES